MIKDIASFLAIMWFAFSLGNSALAKTQEYSLVIDKQTVNLTGKPLQRITINDTIPGPTLEFTEGDDAVIHVTNKLKTDSSVHWHGLLLPGEMDGVPPLNGFTGIRPGETFTYRFKIRQSGTYWYHAHSGAQENDGHYGSMILHPKLGEPVKAERDYIVLISDFHEDEGATIMSNLKKSSEYYVRVRDTVGDFFADVEKHGFSKAWRNSRRWGRMRMMRTDLADISNYTFLVNGKTAQQNWTGLFKVGEKVRLRFINASAMTFYDVRIPGLKMTVVAADGQPVEPVQVDEFRFAVAETYDVIVEPSEDKAYTIAAEAIDRTGFALATLAPRQGMQGEKPISRPMSRLTMADMGGMMGHMDGMDNMGGMGNMGNMRHMGNMGNMGNMKTMMDRNRDASPQAGRQKSGWANANTPVGHTALRYQDLRYVGEQPEQRPPERDIIIRLGGNMQRYIWTLNGKKYEDAKPISLNYGERVRIKFINNTMMAHPMHLHGMFVQLENGQPAAKLPNKHTVVLAPGQTYSVVLTADEVGEWAFHCHLLYHMMGGMMNEVVVARLDDAALSKQRPYSNPEPKQMPSMGHDMPGHMMPGHTMPGHRMPGYDAKGGDGS